MPDTATAKIATRRELSQTLWHCHRCAALIAIYSADAIELAFCPICCDVKLDQRGSFEAILGMEFQERPPVPS
jgi:Zn-finger nucleic acid-binding protein